MGSTTPQTMRSILKSIPSAFIRPSTARSGAVVCSTCWTSRGLSVWSKNALKHTGSPLTRNEQWTRQWSSSAIRRANDDKGRPSEPFYMPPPSDWIEERAAQVVPEHLRPKQPEKQTAPPPASAEEKVPEAMSKAAPSSHVDNVPDTTSDMAPTRPFPVEDSTTGEQTEKPTESTNPIHTPAPKAKNTSTKKPSSSSSTPLPSENERQRWKLSKNTQKMMDDFLAKAAIFSQQLNTYTGTDYSSVEALRREIIEQERDVKARHAFIAAAKEAYTQAHSAQSASQKEVVGLLERKHSWSAADLERYMSLIRSEHLNEQAVQRAKDDLAEAERELEDARSALERKERKQYHEEQIWSDTIRRNSTWVTFGLMGLNILLLLANLVIFEPWRRRRIVREVRTALEENALANSNNLSAVATAANAAAAVPVEEVVVEEQVDDVAEPVGTVIEEVEQDVAEMVPELAQAVDHSEAVEGSEAVGETALATGEVLPEEAIEVVPGTVSEEIAETISAAIPEAASVEPQTWRERLQQKWEHYKTVFQDMFSDRQIALRKVDVTAVALESAAAGMALMGFLVLLFNPR